jgi:DNA-binding MurR/RpiR family transcriptional regulator
MEFPPSDFEHLREYLMKLRQGDIQLEVGKKSLNAMIYMVNNPDAVAVNNIVELASITQISPASITRLAKLLGYKGFNQFQTIFKQRSRVKSDYYSQKVKKLMDESGLPPKEIFRQQMQSALENMQNCLENLDDEYIVDATMLLARKKRVFVFGHKQSAGIANVFRYGLSLIRKEVYFLVQGEHGIVVALGQLRRDDLVVIISSSPYSSLTVDITSMANKQGCQILAITDSTLSPLNDYASISINVPTEGQYFTNSLSANCIFIESLLSLTAMELGQSAVNKILGHEALLSRFNVNS